MHCYEAKIKKVLSGNLLELIIKFGFGITLQVKVKIAHIDILDNKKAKVFLKKIIEKETILVTPVDDSKHSEHYEGTFIINNGKALHELMILEGVAEQKHGKTIKKAQR